MTSSRPQDRRPDDDEGTVPAGPGARLLLAATPFLVVVVVWVVLGWLGG